MKKLLIFGTTQIAEMAHFYFTLTGREVVGFCLDSAYIKENTLLGLPIYPFEEIQKRFPPEQYELFVAIGYSKVNQSRRDKYLEAKAIGYTLPTCISPHAVVHSKNIGDNCLIMDMNNIHPYTRIGSNVLFSNANHVGHHTIIEDHVFIAANVTLCGNVVIGEGSFLGVDCSVREGVKIGRYNVLGMGVAIQKDTADNAIYTAAPAKLREVPSRDVGEL